MIYIIKGNVGSGKTYFLSWTALQKAKQGFKIYYNIPSFNFSPDSLFFPYKEQFHFFSSLEEFPDFDNGVIIMDEAQIYLNSRLWSEMDLSVQFKLQQHRHDFLDIYGTVQHENRLDVVARELVSEFFCCKKILSSRENSKKPWGVIRVSAFDPFEIKDKKANPLETQWFFIRKQIINLYSSYGSKIEYNKPVQSVRHIIQKCEKCDFIKVVHK